MNLDPWSPDAGLRARSWQVFAAAGIGGAYSLLWLLLGQPDVHLSQFFLPSSWVAAGVAALTGSPDRRWARAAPWLTAGIVALAACKLVALTGLIVIGGESLGTQLGRAVLFVVTLVFFGGGWLNIARLSVPSRRLAQGLLDQIPPPAATLRHPRKVTVQMRSGHVDELTLVAGGYIARPRGVDPADVVGITGS